jgi:hypothetical protein
LFQEKIEQERGMFQVHPVAEAKDIGSCGNPVCP